jgi:hypothetical protein
MAFHSRGTATVVKFQQRYVKSHRKASSTPSHPLAI